MRPSTLPLQVINNGHTIQIEWLYEYASDVRIATPGGCGVLFKHWAPGGRGE